jgi:hypothetical protein
VIGTVQTCRHELSAAQVHASVHKVTTRMLQ